MKWFAIGIVVLLVVLMSSCALRPVCVPLSADDVARFTVPIEQRTDRDFYLQVFQRRNGQWHQCKTWISRQLFF